MEWIRILLSFELGRTVLKDSNESRMSFPVALKKDILFKFFTKLIWLVVWFSYSSNPIEVMMCSSSRFYWNFVYLSDYFEVLSRVLLFTVLQGRTCSFYLLVVSDYYVHLWVAFWPCSGPTLKYLALLNMMRWIIWSEASSVLLFIRKILVTVLVSI